MEVCHFWLLGQSSPHPLIRTPQVDLFYRPLGGKWMGAHDHGWGVRCPPSTFTPVPRPEVWWPPYHLFPLATQACWPLLTPHLCLTWRPYFATPNTPFFVIFPVYIKARSQSQWLPIPPRAQMMMPSMFTIPYRKSGTWGWCLRLATGPLHILQCWSQCLEPLPFPI